MHHTPWTKTGSNSLTSDRVRPHRGGGSVNAKGKGKIKEAPKSAEVRGLEALVNAFENSTGKDTDPKGGCFCQARMHTLSSYTPNCRSCGLILCSLNQPHHACPHCLSVLLSVDARTSLVSRLEAEIVEVLAKEAEDRNRAAEEARIAAGAFPNLSGVPAVPAIPPNSSAGSPNMFTPRPLNQTHKVLSLNSKTKKATMTSYSRVDTPVRPLARTEGSEEEPTRVPHPPLEVSYANRTDFKTPWGDGRSDGVTYVPTARAGSQSTSSRDSRKRKHKGKGKDIVEGNVKYSDGDGK